MSGWRGAWLAAALALVTGAAEAQSTYAYRNDTFAYDTPSGSAATVGWHSSGASPGCTQYPNGDDDWADVSFPSGFTFTFGGTAYSGLRVYSNGILAFGNDVSGFHRNYSPVALPITNQPAAYSGCPRAVPVRLMLPYWIDIVAGTANNTSGASVRYEMLGAAPNRRFVISWVNVKLYNTTTRYNFQVALYESAAGVNGNFRYQYTSGSSNGANATVGVQLSTTDYTQYSYNQQFIDTTNGTAILWYPANQLATKTAEYRFDESVWTGTAGEIKDTSGNSRDASQAGNADSTANGRLCRGADIPRNTANGTIDAVATPLTPGQTGSIDFWFRSNSAWNSADAMLFDATTTANRPFFLMKRSTGALRFAVADSAGTTLSANTGSQTFAVNTWHHVGVTWNIRGGTNQSQLQIYIDGVLSTSARGTTTGTLPGLGTLHIGDNRTSGVTPSNGSGNSANGIIDEFYVYSLDVSGPQIQADMNLTRATCTSLDHFHIIHAGSAACGAANVTIEAHDLNHALFSLAGSTMSVATNTGHGSWSAVTAINPVNNVGGGTATYTFADEASVVLALTNPFTETVNINVTSGSITEHSYVAATCSAPDYTFGSVCDADLTFGSCVSAYECLATGLSYNNLTTTPAARNPLYTQLAGTTAFSFDVIALDSSGNRVTSYAADAGKSVTVELVDGAESGACASRTQRETTTLVFTKAGQPTEQGRKAVSFTTARAYQNLLCRVRDTNVLPNVVACSSDRFAVRPRTLDVAATIADYRAGRDFSLTADSGVTAGYDGTPFVDVTRLRDHLGNVTSNLTDIDPISHTDLNPARVEFAAGTGITATGTFQYHDVGSLSFLADAVADTGFTAIDQPDDCVADSTSNVAAGGRFGCNLGSAAAGPYSRFYPDHFIYAATLTPACNGFTYMGQPALGVALTLSAVSLTGAVTSRYTAGYAQLGTFSITATGGGDLARLSPALPGFAWNNGSYTVSAPGTTYTRAATPDGSIENFALQANILTEPDGVQILIPGTPPAADTYAGTRSSNATKLRFGRLRLSNVYGSLSPLIVPVERQYWTGNSWVRNADDTCTTLADANVSLTPPGWGNSIVGGNIRLVPTGPGSVTVCADLGSDHGVNCAATTSAALPWLQSRWPGAATYDNDPAATATFGVFSPEGRRGVYNREMY
ncbi:MAG: LamG domain-containing protein [Rhodocyclales bacterium]|nr:LamG domain-containing protein [Rhodocyclales bacterium]